MKVAEKLIFLFEDADGFGSAIYDALLPNPSSFVQRSEESFELPLDRYGIADQQACGKIAHFVDSNGLFPVSVLLMHYHEPPVLACAVNEVLRLIAGGKLSVTMALPFVVPASKLKCEDKTLSRFNKSSIYSMQLGPETDITAAIISKAQKLPSLLQIHYEPLACLLQFINVLNFPTALLIGVRDVYPSKDTSKDDLELETRNTIIDFRSAMALTIWIKTKGKLNFQMLQLLDDLKVEK
ncbi:hypothetical protein V2J09_009995 [Rumex salicifolius]